MATQKRHIGRYIALSILGAILLLLIIFFAIDYSHYRKDPSPYRTFIIPRLDLALFEVTSLTPEKAAMVGHVLIHNPLPFNLRADSLSYSIFIAGSEVIKSTYPNYIDIKKWDTTMIDLPVTTFTDKLVTVLTNAEKEGKDSVVYEIKTSFGTKLIAYKEFNLDIQKLLPLFYIPQVKMDSILYDSLSADGVTLILPTQIINKNKIDFQVKDVDFKFKLADNKWVEGGKFGVIDIKQQAVTPLTIPIRISFKEIGRSILPLLKHGKNTPFQLNVTMKMVSASNALKNSLIVLNDAGAIKEIVKLAKEEKKKAAQNPDKPEKKTKIKIKKAQH